ncbi:hypothetical protein PPTG_18026 [Phytophthora nicotianae INRA-310]|uniref:N-acetyltransferase domain-containing protein n=2 Tax=Phytophthora nicotianae TaxID=4792 RepID=W2PI73_PHYN3|nr:hypothetical protein PPTG_18026 [Phytophthora nicotianae INRA-310]ETN00321.1 hypothetical protein PPTG_18026 [Phytophthora nicotianae INRA-310]
MTTVDQQLANLVIRQYRSLDHEEVVQLYLNGMRSYSFEGEDEASKTLWEQVRQASVNSDLADIEGVYLTSGGNFWVAVVSSSDREEEVIAMVGLQLHSGDLGELRCMSVKEGYRRVGLGRKLLKHLEDWAQTHGLKRVKLSTGMTMTRAVQFYMAHGYTLTHTTIFTPEMPHEEAHLAKDLFVMFSKKPACDMIGSTSLLTSVVQLSVLMATVKQPEFCIRQYAPQDQEGVNAVFIDGCEFYRDSFPSHVQEHWTEFIQEGLDGDLSRILSAYIAPGGNFWVVTTPENSVHKVVGIVGLEDKGDGVGELRRMAVSSAFRRHGLGRRLVNELETWAKDHGFTKIFLMNGGPKEDARAFYRAIGYQDVGMKVVSVEPHVEVFQLAKQL